MNGEKPERKKPSNNNNMGEDWTREADRLAERHNRFIKKENEKKERQLKKALEKETNYGQDKLIRN